ncbi:hypothetical protein [Streptomyces sp. NEAU-S7GS2]|uniref:hypothetical protein n=1 Tax=Streptomyces sp. NEAU-S7GS2 TaxID=2202000 RepID=UPI001950360C|nr:hypothetical protein [Streptomyces sp. NEAU-S7GS2]
MSGGPVDPADVPVFTGDLDVLEAKTKALSRGGSKVHTAGSDVHKSFGGLAAFYKAPEAEQLFGVTKPVADTAHDLSDDMHVIAGALSTYAREIRPLIHRLKQLKQEAADFRDNEAAEDDWSEDGDLVEENLSRRNKIAEVWAAFQEAERDCHAKIVALVGGKALHTIDASHKKGYGYDAGALKASKSLPWGDAVEESVPWWQVWEHAYDFGKGFIVDGVGGTIDGIYTLFGGHGGDAAGEAWAGLAKLSTAVAITTTPGLNVAYWMAPGKMLPSWLRDSRTAVLDTGKALVAWDQWESNGSRAAGAVTFNIVTAVFTRGGGAAVQGAGKAGALAKGLSVVSKVGSAVDPMTYVIKGAGAGLSKVGDVMAHLKGLGHVEVPKISEGAYSLPEGAAKMPDGTIQLPGGAAIPEGATKLPDGRIELPKDTVTFPPNTVKDPSNGKYMSGRGDLYNEDGSLFQRAEDARKENPAPPAAGADNPRIETPAHQEQRVPASVGGPGDDFTRVGSEISDPAHFDDASHGSTRAGDNTPMGRAGDHGAPGGSAGNHMPTNNLDNNPTGGGGRITDTTPTTGGGHTGTPSTSSGGRDLPGGSTAENGLAGGSTTSNGIPGSGHPESSVLDALDNAARARESIGDNAGANGAAGDNAATSAGENQVGGTPAPHQPVPRPEFMLDGPNPYGPRGRLTLEQIEEIQVYRANHEPGYFKDYYKGGEHLGDRKSLELTDESGLTPPQLTRLSDDSPLIRAKDAPEPPKPHFLDADYIPVGADTVTGASRLKILHEAAQERHFAIQWDKLVESWKAEAGKAHEAHATLETAGLWGEAKGTYKESHTQMGDLAEKFGETAAEHHFVAERYPDFDKQTLLGPKNGNDQFDQVWKHEDGRVVVIEAKSNTRTDIGSRTLPDGRKVSQGSREYFFDIIRMMKKRGELGVVGDLERALADGKLEYVVVKGERNAGRYTGLQYRRFDISKGTLP